MESVILEEDIDENYEPTEAEIEEYAQVAATPARGAGSAPLVLPPPRATGSRARWLTHWPVHTGFVAHAAARCAQQPAVQRRC